MRIADIRLLFEYNHWANTRLLDVAARVPTAIFATAVLVDCRLPETLMHILEAERGWRLRWQEIEPETIPFPDSFPTFEALRARWAEEDRQFDAFLATLDDAALDHAVTFNRSYPVSDTRTRWHLMMHVFTHSMQHRSEVAMLLTSLGYSPGPLDLTVFVRQQQP